MVLVEAEWARVGDIMKVRWRVDFVDRQEARFSRARRMFDGVHKVVSVTLWHVDKLTNGERDLGGTLSILLALEVYTHEETMAGYVQKVIGTSRVREEHERRRRVGGAHRWLLDA